MEYVCGTAAVTLGIAGVMLIASSMRSGKVFDCMEGSETEQQWIFRHENPGKYAKLMMFYSIFFATTIVLLGWAALGGKIMP